MSGIIDGLSEYLRKALHRYGRQCRKALEECGDTALPREELGAALNERADRIYARPGRNAGTTAAWICGNSSAVVLLRAVDTRWMDHIDAMDQLREGIGLQRLRPAGSHRGI